MTESQDDIAAGIGIGVGIAVIGVLVALIPAIVGISGIWSIVCYLLSPIVAAAGFAGCTIEFDKFYKQEHFSNMGVGLFLAAPGVSMLIARRVFDWPIAVDIVVTVLALLFVVFGIVGFFMGLAGAIARRRRGSIRRSHTNEKMTHRSQVGGERQEISRGDILQVSVAIASTIIASVLAVIMPILTAGK